MSAREEYERDGFVVLEDVMSSEEVSLLRSVAGDLVEEDASQRVLEDDGDVRSLYGLHERSVVIEALTRDSRVVGPAVSVLGSDVYVFQTQLNPKGAFNYGVWPWHDDFTRWHELDGMPYPWALNVSVLLDDLGALNGPLLLMPRSHRASYELEATGDGGNRRLPRHELVRLANENGIVQVEARAGSLVLFDCRLLHGSGANMSSGSRTILFVRYSSVENRLVHVPEPRDESRAARTAPRVTPLPSGTTFARAAGLPAT